MKWGVTIKRICVIGSGNGAFALAADLKRTGLYVTLCVDETKADRVKRLKETRKLHLKGMIEGDFEIDRVVVGIENGIKDADVVILTLVAHAHEDFARSIASHIRPNTDVILCPGSTGGALIFARIFKELGKYENIRFSEFSTLPYAVRKEGEDTLMVYLKCKSLMFATFPAKHGDEAFRLAQSLLPDVEMVKARDVLETGLNNGNPISHPAPVLLNAGKIEYYGKNFHYREGITPSVARVIEALDEERLKIVDHMGYAHIKGPQRLYDLGYARTLEDSMYKSYQSSTGIFLDIEGPNSLESRYMTEDVPKSLVTMSALAKRLGIETPTIDSVIQLSSILMNEDYYKIGRKLACLGIENMDREELHEFLMEGYQ